MTKVQLEGMRARASHGSTQRNPYPHRTVEHLEWKMGFDVMDLQIRHLLDNGESMLRGLEQFRNLPTPEPA